MQRLQPLQPFVDWYLKNYFQIGDVAYSHKTLFEKQIRDIPGKILSASGNTNAIVDIFFNNSHFWALKSYQSKTVYKPLRKKFTALKPWTQITGNFKDYEDLFQWLNGHIKSYGVSQLYVYDLALWLSTLDSSNKLFPANNVYVHATPLLAYKALCKKGYFSHPAKGNAIIPISVFQPHFSQLTSYSIEDLLCHIGKCIRMIKNGNTTKKSNAKLPTGCN